MLDWLLATLSPERARERGRQEALKVANAETFLGRPIAEMRLVEAPAAENDNPLAEVYVEVERELRRAGYLG